MNFITDAFLEVGTKSNKCEDYILDGFVLDLPFIVLSDGCSGSNFSDIGARIYCHRYPWILRRFPNYTTNELGEMIIAQAQLANNMLSVPVDCLDATLVALRLEPNLQFATVDMFGDGIIIFGYRDGSVTVTDVEYDQNCPFYLSYHINDAKHTYVSCIKEKTISYFSVNENGVFQGMNHGIKDPTIPEQKTEAVELLKYVMIASDGLKSFLRSDGTIIPLQEVVLNLTAFKSFKGEFLQRRVKRMISNYKKEGTTHYDDISVGAIYFGEDDNA